MDIGTILYNVVNSYTESEYNISLDDKKKELEGVFENFNVENKEFINLFSELGITQEIIEEVNQAVPGIQKLVGLLIQYHEETSESLQNSVFDISRQLHSDKISMYKSLPERYKKRHSTNDTEDIKRLNIETENLISALQSEINRRIEICESIPKTGKKMIFGWLEVRRVEQAMAELKETLSVYVSAVKMLSGEEIYLGKLESAQETLFEAEKYMTDIFSVNCPEKNRMYTLTDDEFWISEPKKLCRECEEVERKIESIYTEFKSCKKIEAK